MGEVTQQQVVEYIKGISVLELSQLVKTLESELGVSAAAPMMGMPMGAGGAAAASAPPAELRKRVGREGIGRNLFKTDTPTGRRQLDPSQAQHRGRSLDCSIGIEL